MRNEVLKQEWKCNHYTFHDSWGNNFSFSGFISIFCINIKSDSRYRGAEIRSNAIIEAHDLSQSLQNKLETVTTNLQTISSAHSVQTGSELMAQPILNATQMSTASLTDGYYWLDSNGNMVVIVIVTMVTIQAI